MTDVASLIVKVGTQGVKGAADQLDRLETQGEKTTRTMKSLATAFAGIAASSAAFGALATASIQSSKELIGFARVANTSLESFQNLAFGAKSVGVQTDKLSDILKDVSDKVGDFLTTGGGPLIDFFEKVAPQVGVTAEEFRNLSGKDSLQLYISSLEKANLSQNEMVFFLEAIASDATLLLPLFQKNGEAQKEQAKQARALGLALSDIDAANISKAGVEIDKVGAVLSAVSQQFGAEVAPLISDIGESFLDATKNAGGVGEIASKLSDIFVEAAKVAEVFAVVIGSRIVTSLTLAAAAQVRYGAAVLGGTAFVTRATTATAAHAAALGGVTLAARTAAVSIGALRGGMALLGGTTGVVILAAAALFTFARRAREATQSTGDLAKNINTLTVEAAGVRLKSLGKTLKEASFDFDKARFKIRNIQRELRRNPNNTRLQADLKGFEDKLASAKKNVETLKTLETELTAIVNDPNREATLQAAADAQIAKDEAIVESAVKRKAKLIAIKNAQDKLLSQSASFLQSIKTPTELFNEQKALLEKLASTLDANTGKALINADELELGIKLAREEMERLNETESPDQFIDGIHGLNDSISETETIFSQLQTASEGFSESFANSLIEGGTSFENFANGILKQLQKIALQKAFDPIFGKFSSLLEVGGRSLLGLGSGISPTPGDIAGTPFEGGGFTGRGPRSGGVDGRGGFNAVLHPNETVIDHTKNQGAFNNAFSSNQSVFSPNQSVTSNAQEKSVSVSNNIVVNVDASGSSTQGDGGGRDLGNLIGIAVRSVLIEEKRPGGMLA